MSMMVDNNTTSGTGSQSNSTTEVGGTQSRSTASPEEFAQMLFCLATVIQQSSSPAVPQEPPRADQPGMGFPLVMGRRADHAGSGEQADKTDTTTMINTGEGYFSTC